MSARDDAAERSWALSAISRYAPKAPALLIPPAPAHVDLHLPVGAPLATVAVELPEWAADLGVDRKLRVPKVCLAAGEAPPWERTDWFAAVFLLASGAAERAHEERHGTIQSYSFRLFDRDESLWQRAWVNRIALFLRRSAAQRLGREEAEVCGPLPAAEIRLTHDVDAVDKTMVIRAKQSAFRLFNATRAASQRDWSAARAHAADAIRFALGRQRYWYFEDILDRERACGVSSEFMFYAGGGGWARPPRAQLLDPGYDVLEPRLIAMIRRLKAVGCNVGLHGSAAAWDDPAALRRERLRLEQALDGPVADNRQHWLLFSWGGTWRAQEEAGLRRDYTLGFNDRPGFRISAALAHHPWDASKRAARAIESWPLILMDSQVYDYATVDPDERVARMRAWIDEVRAVRGQATVIWHQQVMGDDYGWADGFGELLQVLSGPDSG